MSGSSVTRPRSRRFTLWFKVDDQLAMHFKTMQAGNRAIGVWVRAGAWAAGNLTDGFVPESLLPALAADRDDVDALVAAGFWREVEGGWQFHDWDEYQPTSEQVKAKRDADRDRKRKQRRNGSGQFAKVSRRDSERNPEGVTADVAEMSHRPVPVPVPVPETLMVTTSCKSSSVTREKDGLEEKPVDNAEDDADGYNPWAVVNAMEEHAGVAITLDQAAKIAHAVMSRRRIDPTNPTAYILAAIRNDPHEILRDLMGVAS